MVSTIELERRWKLVRDVMAREELDWLLCAIGMPGGYATWLSDRPILGATDIMNILAFPIEGESFFATHGDSVHTTPVDSYGVRHLVLCAQPILSADTVAPVIVEVLKPSRPRRIGLLGKGFMPVSAYQTFVTALPDVDFVDAADLIAPIKAVKSEEELACMKQAAAMHDNMVEVLRKTVRSGITANDVVEEVRHAFRLVGSRHQEVRGGSAPPGQICRYGAAGDRVMRQGDQFAMLMECSESGGYFSEMMPTVCIGKVPAELQKAFDDVLEAQEILMEMAMPGADPMEMLRASDRFMEKKGYPAEGRLAGHSQGIDLVERPALSPLGETIKLEENMVISLHPTVHASGAWGYPVSHSFLITRDGPQRMTKTPQEIIVV